MTVSSGKSYHSLWSVYFKCHIYTYYTGQLVMEIPTDVNAVYKRRVCRKRIGPVKHQCVPVHPIGTDVFCKRRDDVTWLNTVFAYNTWINHIWIYVETFYISWMHLTLVYTWIYIINLGRLTYSSKSQVRIWVWVDPYMRRAWICQPNLLSG